MAKKTTKKGERERNKQTIKKKMEQRIEKGKLKEKRRQKGGGRKERGWKEK